MAVYKFRAINIDGSKIDGSQRAVSYEAAYQLIKDRGLYPVKITEVARPRKFSSSRKLSKKARLQFIRQLATLLDAGVSLLDAMDSLSKSGSDETVAERAVVMLRQLRQGERPGQCLRANFPEMPDYVFALTELGESTGQLGASLSDAADRLAADQKLATDIRSALTYPAILASVGSLIILGMFIFVIPRFGALVERSEADIPFVSRLVIDTGIWMRTNWLLFFALLIATIFIIRFLLTRSKGAVLTVAGHLPGVGAVLLKAEFERWSRTLGVALSNGAELLDALGLAAGAIQSPKIRAQLAGLRRDVRSGADIDEALRTNLPSAEPFLLDLLATGRKSGTLPRMLILAADGYKQDVETLTKRVTAIAEPAAILILSSIVGGLVVSVVLAMTSIYQIDVG